MPRCAKKKSKILSSPKDPLPKDLPPRESPPGDLPSRDPKFRDTPPRYPSQATYAAIFTSKQAHKARNEQFILQGKDQNGFMKDLKIPSKKIFDVNNQTILRGENQGISCDQSVFDKRFPYRAPDTMRKEIMDLCKKDRMFLGHRDVNPNILDNFFCKHGFPLAQGPAIPPIDKEQFGCMDKTQHEVFKQRTEYSHSQDQECYEWIPTRSGLAAWIRTKFDDPVSYSVSRSRSYIAGAASTSSMSIMYTCTLQGCIIFCPCHCCIDIEVSCKKICGNYPCTNCSRQCTEHYLRLPRAFDPATDQFTVVTDRIDCARYIIPYTGIPISCQNCTQDTYEHQIFHHVFHGRCKFCVMEMRPIRNLIDDTSLKAFKVAVASVRNKDERTCAHCLKILDASYERKVHEKTIHEKVDGNHKCNVCRKNYTNSTALNYHLEKHKDSDKISCEFCNKTFVSQNGLSIHREIAHYTEPENARKYSCEQCDKKFTNLSNLARHKRIKHFKSNANKEFAECFKYVDEFQCDQCESIFKRKDYLKRHKQAIHDISSNIQCPSCEKSFNRSDKLAEHIKSQHSIVNK